MNEFEGLFSSPWVEAIGWTLLHSLWQSVLVSIIVMLAMRCIPSRFSTPRYVVATAGLASILLLSTGTFFYISSGITSGAGETIGSFYRQTADVVENSDQSSFSVISGQVSVFVERNIGGIVLMWSIGALFCSLRVFSGWWYIRRLRRSAVLLGEIWSNRVQTLSASLQMRQFIPLAESPLIHAPIVIGYLRPIILLPVGMCSGLSTEQLESIILHELIHIKRNDYLVNIMQAFMEAMYFFNPFVWMISGVVRHEREHCCDDAVVKSAGNPLAYVRALATLEEARFLKSGLALSFAEDKNQLLNRIKRIMEKSVKNYSGRERIIPFALLIVGLICASWITIQSRMPDGNATMNPIDPSIASDTTGRRKFSRTPQEAITLDHEVNPAVDVVKQVEVNELLNLNLAVPAVPAVPDIEIVISPVALRDVYDMNIDMAIAHDIQRPRMNLVFPAYFQMDTVPGDWVNRDWDDFSKEFEKKFADRFGDFYIDHQKELENLLEELEHKFDHHFNEQMAAKMEDLARKEEHIALINKIEISRDGWEKQEEAMKRAEMDMKRMELENERQLQRLEENVKAMERSMHSFQKELRDQLIKDGYLEADEKINSIEIKDEQIRINKKEIKPSDQKKYQKLFEKFSQGPTHPIRKPYNSPSGRKE